MGKQFVWVLRPYQFGNTAYVHGVYAKADDAIRAWEAFCGTNGYDAPYDWSAGFNLGRAEFILRAPDCFAAKISNFEVQS